MARWVPKTAAGDAAATSPKGGDKGKGKENVKGAGKGKGKTDAKGSGKSKYTDHYDAKGYGKWNYHEEWNKGKGKEFAKGANQSKGKTDVYSKGAGKGDGKSKSKGDDSSPKNDNGEKNEFGLGQRPYYSQLKEVFTKTNLQPTDIDAKAVQLFDTLGEAGKTDDVVKHLKESLDNVERGKVSNWSAYLFTLLRKFDPEAYATMREQRGRPKREHRKKAESSVPNVQLNVEAPAFVPGQQWGGVKTDAAS